MAGMTARHVFFGSLIVLSISVIGDLIILVAGVLLFSYPKNDLDWMFLLAGLFILTAIGSALSAAISGTVLLIGRPKRGFDSN